jgi:hypothetical protein
MMTPFPPQNRITQSKKGQAGETLLNVQEETRSIEPRWWGTQPILLQSRIATELLVFDILCDQERLTHLWQQ